MGSFGLAGPGTAAFSCGAACVEELNKDEDGAFWGLEVRLFPPNKEVEAYDWEVAEAGGLAAAGYGY